MENKIKLFEDKKIRVAWNEDEQDWYFSIVDVISVLNKYIHNNTNDRLEI